MRRVQVQLEDDVAGYLADRASREDRSIGELMGDIVRRERTRDDRQRRIDIALAALEKPAFSSGLGDVSERHDEYFVQGLEEEMRERWR
jgi:hypothetical protein